MSNVKPKLSKAVFYFNQEPNCCSCADVEELEMTIDSSCGIDFDDGEFYILKTDGWAIDGEKDIKELIDRVSKAVNK